ncbi:MAG: helix-turn-helix domain-containing protein, partial [Chlamydiales bacterium]|nr:helix-turn-helix domain-containing protein [Chlamydiales bacterium]
MKKKNIKVSYVSVQFEFTILQFVEKCGSITEAARVFGISKPTIYNWLKLKEKEGSLAAKRPKRPW